MGEHYTRNTVSAEAWCPKCGKRTQHRVDDRRLGPCLECIEHLDQEKQKLSEAQFVLCRGQLHSDRCPICERMKECMQCFCRRCYFALPKPMQSSLWINRTDQAGLIQWAESYTAAKDWLRRQFGESTGNLFEAMT